MKILFIAALLSLSSAALAMPAIGDYARYDGTITQGTSVLAGTVEQEITAQNAQAQYDVKQTQTVQGQGTSSSDTWTNASDLVTDAQIQQVLTYCAQLGGTLQTLTTAAGAINSCAVPLQDQTGTAWYAAVPFGLAKIDRVINGERIVLTISTFRAGN